MKATPIVADRGGVRITQALFTTRPREVKSGVDEPMWSRRRSNTDRFTAVRRVCSDFDRLVWDLACKFIIFFEKRIDNLKCHWALPSAWVRAFCDCWAFFWFLALSSTFRWNSNRRSRRESRFRNIHRNIFNKSSALSIPKPSNEIPRNKRFLIFKDSPANSSGRRPPTSVSPLFYLDFGRLPHSAVYINGSLWEARKKPIEINWKYRRW